MIRKARPEDLRRIQDIEVAAGELFRGIGMDAISEAPPPSVDELMAYQRAGRAWVATDPADHPIAYILVDIVEGRAHIEQVTVHPRHSRKGLGSGLIDHVTLWAREMAFSALTLTTLRDVPWNAPYYERLGFRQLPEKEWPEGLRKIVQRENQHGLAVWPRTVLVKDLSAASGTDCQQQTEQSAGKERHLKGPLNGCVPEEPRFLRDGAANRRRTFLRRETPQHGRTRCDGAGPPCWSASC